jgi:hypothetical protein
VPEKSVSTHSAHHRLSEMPPDPHRLPPEGSWFMPDAEAHLLDRPRFCPMCAVDLDEHGGIATEYWMGDSRVFMTWCGGCGWFGEVVRFDMVTIQEEEH